MHVGYEAPLLTETHPTPAHPSLPGDAWVALWLPFMVAAAIGIGVAHWTNEISEDPEPPKEAETMTTPAITPATTPAERPEATEDAGETPEAPRSARAPITASSRHVATRLEHIHLTVRDADRSIDFYRRVFGFEVRYDGIGPYGRSVHVGTDQFYLALTEVERPVGGPRSRFLHLGLTTDDLEALRDRLDREDVEVTEEANRPEGRAVYFEDPDGFEIEVVEYVSGYAYR